MANGKASQIQAKYQRPANAIYRVGPSGSGFFFTTVQAAINQAVTDLFDSATNPATVEISPGNYTENVVLKPGVSLAGAGGVTITGTCTYPVSNGSTRTLNSISLTNLILSTTNGITLSVSGTAPIQLTLNGVQVEKLAGDPTAAYEISNTGSGSRVRFNAGSSVNHNVTNSPAMNLVRGTTEFRQRNTTIFSTGNILFQAAVVLTNSAALRVWGCDNWFVGAATNVIDIQSASAAVDLLHSVMTNTTSGGNGILFTAAGTVRLKHMFCNINANVAGYLAKGAGGTFIYGASLFANNAQVQNTLTIQTETAVVTAVA